MIGARRSSWRSLAGELEANPSAAGTAYKVEFEKELQTTCNEILNLLQENLLKSCDNEGEAKVFYLKMIGDYYRYLVLICVVEIVLSVNT